MADPSTVPSPDELRDRLTSEQWHVTQEKGTERAFTGELWDNHADGTYTCVVCGQALFSSETKYESGSGWPSFWQPLADDLGDRLAGLLGEPQVALQQPAEVTQVLARQRVVQTQLRSHPGEFRGAGPQADDLACRVPGRDGQDQEDQQHDGEQ